MKNQYFGDINDFKKYGLLRSIISASNLNILIAWMLTTDDGSTDGKFIEYLEKPEKWEKYDKELYSELVKLIQNNKERKVSLIENSEVLNRCKYFSNNILDPAEQREIWFSDLVDKSKNSDLIFLDPDNGLEIKSTKYGTRNSSKFLYCHEVKLLWELGKSLLIYQHFIREKRQTFTQRMLKNLKETTDGSIVESFSTSNVVFLLALQPDHHKFHLPIINTVKNSWQDQISSYT